MRALLNSSRWHFERFLALAFCLALVIAPATARASGHSEDSQPVTAQSAQREFAGRLVALQAILAEIGDAGPDAAQQAALAAEKQALIALDTAVRQEQAAIAQRLAAAGLPDVILARQAATADMHAAQFSRLMEGLAAIEAAQGTEPAAALAAARELLAAGQPRPRDLPRDQPLPRQKIRQAAPVLDVSSLATAPAAIAAAPATPPTQADLDPTIDVQLTDEITALAASLGHSPLLMYRYVRDHIGFEAYLGSRKGSRETLLVGSGNDYDQASLLIALLRASNIPARYITGEVYLPAGQVMNWLGVDDAATAASLLATAGMQATAYGDGYGNIVAIAFNHVWVAAYVPYGNYRGIANDATGKMWAPLDPSLKAYDYAPAVDIPAAMGFNAEAFIDSYITTMHEPSPVELYLQQIEAWMAANRPDLAYPDDAFRSRAVVPDTLEFLPASLPFIVLSKDAEYAEIPASARHRIRFVIEDNYGYTLLDYTANLPAIASRRVTISYIPATPADEATIASYGDLYLTPPNLIHLKPVLRVDGAAVATGGSIAAGISHYSDMYFLPPSGDSNEVPAVYNNITAGAYQGIGIDTYRVGMGIFVPASDGALPDTDGITGEKLYRTAMAYLDRVDQADRTIAETMQMAFTTSVSEAIVENVILVWTSYGTPVDWEWRGLIVDADRKIIGPFSAAGDAGEEKAFMVLAGADGSISENRIFEDTYGEEAVSTIKILELSSDQGIPICRVQTSIAADCPGLAQPSYVVNAINNALAQGHHVTIPQAGITYYQWEGTGYIDMEPATGAAGYIIAGGQNGGATVDIWIGPWALIFDTIFRDVCGITANITYPAEGEYFPYPGFWSGLLHPQPPRFDVDYTVSYCNDGSKVVNESFRPHYQYGPGDYTFFAGWGTGATRNFTIFGVEVETPDDIYAPKDGDPITLNAKVNPRVPPGATFQWAKESGDGDGAFAAPTTQQTAFTGSVLGELDVKVVVSNANGNTDADKEVMVFGLQILPDSRKYMARGYTGAPVAGDPEAAAIKYKIEPSGFLGLGGFTPTEVKAKVSRGGTDVRTATLPNTSGENTWNFDGKDDANNYLDANVYQVKIEVTAPGGKKLTSNAHDLTVVEVTGVALQDAGGGALTNNAHPDQPGGLRVWVGKPTAAGAVVDKVRVVVTLSAAVPANELNIYLESYDVDDPTGLIDANHAGTLGHAEGLLSEESPSTDGDNNVQVEFTVTRQPGDNFKVFASTNEALINNLTDAIVEANTNNAGDTTNARLQPLASPRLTVWRRVHVELDSMGTVTGNSIAGNLNAVVHDLLHHRSTVTTNQNLNETPNAINRFEDGLLRQGANAFPVISNTDGANFQVVVSHVGVISPTVAAFTLVDDDDFNSNDGANPDGDSGDDVAAPDLGLISDSDSGANNRFAYAYVRPTYDLGGNSNVGFVLNVVDSGNIDDMYEFANMATEADNDFWTVYLLGGYQWETSIDGDPAIEGAVLGQVDAINGIGASVFLEAVDHETTATAVVNNAASTAHEIGHLFKGSHDAVNGIDGGLMDQSSTRTSTLFTDATLTKIRDIDHP